jgi:transposase-like protein
MVRGDRVQFRIGDIRAHCPSCKGDEFTFDDGARARNAATFTCDRCGVVTTYAALLDQITAAVTRQATELLRRLKKES